MFPTLAALASDIVRSNVGEGKITVIGKLSTSLSIGPDGDLPRKADMLISEILDSALLGEGVLPFLRHALNDLVTSEAIVVPQSAAIFARLADVPAVSGFHAVPTNLPSGITLMRDDRAVRCKGGRGLLPVHADHMQTPIRPLSETMRVFDFDLTRPSVRCERRSRHAFST